MPDLLPGTLEMLVLRTLTLEPRHGYGIARHIEQSSGGTLRIEQGSLYPALERLLRSGKVTARWSRSPTGRRARFYTITRSGRSALKEKTASYNSAARAIERIMSET
jgi:PadR family transcriptional regulator, regulatory protein PadR